MQHKRAGTVAATLPSQPKSRCAPYNMTYAYSPDEQRQGQGCGWNSDELTAACLLATLLCCIHSYYIHICIFLSLAYHVIMRTQNSNKILGPREKCRATVSETDGCCIRFRTRTPSDFCQAADVAPSCLHFPTHTPIDTRLRLLLLATVFKFGIFLFLQLATAGGPGQIVCKF